MAEVGSVFGVIPAPRTPADIIATATTGPEDPHTRAPGPRSVGKWLTASVTAEASQVIASVFDEAHRRDPDHQRTWIALVDAAIRRTATRRQLTAQQRANADTAADYLHNKKRHLDYPSALAAGWPIATGIIEGACRHLVKDRMDITGARWGLDGAEAILKLRALATNGDFDAYWTYHQQQERLRVHNTLYWNQTIPP